MEELNENLITFGKYQNKYVSDLLKDRKYCAWLLDQPWFRDSYEYLFNKVSQYKPLTFFLKEFEKTDNFIDDYIFFNLKILEDLEILLNENEQKCYLFYLKTIDDLKTKIKVRIAKNDENIFDIKAPSKLLQNFEKESELKRDDFKAFLSVYDLPTISIIIEDIKKQGGLEYNGGKSYTIGKKRSKEQEQYWEKILKEKYGDEIGVQFKYKDCFFDFVNIKTNTIFECKLGMKDYNEEQYKKYLLTLDKYNIIYLISTDCVINLDLETIYTTNLREYLFYQCNIPLSKNPSKLDDIIFEFDLVELDDLSTVI